jgi:eukaryotic-like serine/threonine-protein kinase
MAKWDAARWRAVSAEIDQILDLPREARQAALDALRARDAALAADVARLLAEQPAVEAGGFLDGDAASALPTFSSTSEDGVVVPRLPVTLPPGATFGSYRIHRMLGRGGMGIVYEAEEIQSGRRIALKILQGRFDDDRERERFEREGQLAASIDHEHCVFVFGAAEVDGTPSIAMELMQGTLADRIASQGPMPPAAAVDAALQLVAGLHAAQAAGILHRDVKPSNCFVDADGVVKIGDFGISRSIRPTQETTRATRGLVAATPAYAPPEQLRGAPLDARSDIYSLGATIYELLTTERPFTGADLMSLLMAVANDPPRPPHVVAPAVPKGLSQVVLRCLAKRPEDRFQSYAALAAALEPHASWSPTPATLGRRFVAGAIDHLIILVPTLAAWFALFTWWFAPLDAWMMLAQLACTLAIVVPYFGVCENRWGAAIGKALMGLTVVDAAGSPPRARATFVRSCVFVSPRVAITLAWIPFATEIEALMRAWPALASYGSLVAQALVWSVLFWTGRRRNGYAGLHDLASGTRVVTRAARATHARVSPARAATRENVRRSAAYVGDGGFVTVEGSIEGRPGWRPGYDMRLGRAVWIRELAIGTPPVATARASLARPTRLRWLAGRRTDREAWDVYEAVDGVPLACAVDRAPGWEAARQWLADLAHELAAQDPEDRPPLDPDRVWILASGRAKLLDDPTEDPPHDSGAGAPALLAHVMRQIRSRDRAPWPVSAERLWRGLPEATPPDIAAQLDAMQHARPAMTGSWRLVTLGPFGVLAAVIIAIFMVASVGLYYQKRFTPPDVRVALDGLKTLRIDDNARRSGRPASHRHRLSDGDREAIEIFLVSRHRATLADDRLSDPRRLRGAQYGLREIAEDVMRRRPAAAADGDAAAAAAAANPRVRRLVREALEDAWLPAVTGWVAALFVALGFSAIVALILAAACRGVVLRQLGFEIVSADGLPASRLRVTVRAAVAWSPVLLAFAVILALGVGGAALDSLPWILVPAVSLLVFAAGAAVAVASPLRGIQDRLAGTWIVPR